MKSLQSLTEAAGLGHFPARATIRAMVAVSAVIGCLFFALSGIPAFGFAGLVFGLIGTLEGLFGVARAREQSVTSALPEVVESLASAVSSGQSLSTAFEDLAKHGPKALSKSISAMVRLDELGIPFDECLNWLRVELSDVNADSLIELLIASNESGGVGLVENLTHFAANLRAELVIRGELQAKQGWVTGTAKLALIAPWIVAWMLSRRAEAASFYCSSLGDCVLFIGLLVCVGAYLLIVRFGRLAKPVRVFA
jgi:tight adherence protein B